MLQTFTLTRMMLRMRLLLLLMVVTTTMTMMMMMISWTLMILSAPNDGRCHDVLARGCTVCGNKKDPTEQMCLFSMQFLIFLKVLTDYPEQNLPSLV